METLVIHTESQEQLEALKALVKSWGISAEKYPYNPAFVAEIKQREENIEKGETVTVKDPKNIWESIL